MTVIFYTSVSILFRAISFLQESDGAIYSYWGLRVSDKWLWCSITVHSYWISLLSVAMCLYLRGKDYSWGCSLRLQPLPWYIRVDVKYMYDQRSGYLAYTTVIQLQPATHNNQDNVLWNHLFTCGSQQAYVNNSRSKYMKDCP